MFKNRKGFSLVELVIVIAIMAVLIAVLAPALMQYTERSRAQKDATTMDEVTNAVMLTMNDSRAYDEVVALSTPNNVSCYIDNADETTYQYVLTEAASDGSLMQYTFDNDARRLDETPYFAAGNMRGITITFEPELDDNGEYKYTLENGVINKFYGKKMKLGDTQYLYNTIRQTIGDSVIQTSQTYRNSEYTIFIVVGTMGGNQADSQDAVLTYGQYSGTNLPPTSPSTYTTTENRNELKEESTDFFNPMNPIDNPNLNIPETEVPGTPEVILPTPSFTPMLNGQEYIIVDGTMAMSFILAEEGVQILLNGEPITTIPASCIIRENTKMTVSNTGTEYDGVYEFFANGYVELNGTVVAKAKDMWVTLPQDAYIVSHDGNLYSSEDGNHVYEFLTHENLIAALGALESVFADGTWDKEELANNYGYQFDSFDGENIKLGNVFDVMAAQNIQDEGLYFLFSNSYKYWGGSARDSKVNNEMITTAQWSSSDVSLVSSVAVHIVNNVGSRKMACSEKLVDGLYKIVASEQYYYKGNPTDNIFFVDDYPFAYADGMTYREWMDSDYVGMAILNDYGSIPEYVPYIPREDWDKLCGDGSGSGIGLIFVSNAMDPFYPELTFGCNVGPCEGDIYFYHSEDSYKEHYDYSGLWYGYGQRIIEPGKPEKSYELYAYYCESGLIHKNTKSIDTCFAYKKQNNIPTVDISRYLSKYATHVSSGTTSRLEWGAYIDVAKMSEELGIPGDIQKMLVTSDGDYIIELAENEQTDSFGRGNYIATRADQHPNKQNRVGISFYYDGKYYEGWLHN